MAAASAAKGIRLRAKEVSWVPRHPIINEATGEIDGYRAGLVLKGQDIVWRGKIEDAPGSLDAMNPEDQAALDEAREQKQARIRLARRDQAKNRLRSELKAEIEAEIRDELKAELRGEMAARPKAGKSAPAAPAS